jgi:hypothetical protein
MYNYQNAIKHSWHFLLLLLLLLLLLVVVAAVLPLLLQLLVLLALVLMVVLLWVLVMLLLILQLLLVLLLLLIDFMLRVYIVAPMNIRLLALCLLASLCMIALVLCFLIGDDGSDVGDDGEEGGLWTKRNGQHWDMVVWRLDLAVELVVLDDLALVFEDLDTDVRVCFCFLFAALGGCLVVDGKFVFLPFNLFPIFAFSTTLTVESSSASFSNDSLWLTGWVGSSLGDGDDGLGSVGTCFGKSDNDEVDELGEEVDDNKDEEDGDEGGGLTVVENDLVDGGSLDESGVGGLDRCEVDEDLVEDEQ